MSAVQRTRKPWQESNRSFESKTLIESSNEISISQKIDIIMNGTPDPNETGLYKSQIVSINYDTNTIELSSTAEASKFEEGETVVLYPEDDYRINKIKNCVKSVSGVYVELYAKIPFMPNDITIEKNLIFRVSNLSSYREDEFGIFRFYDAIAGVSEIESSMGEFLEGKWNRSDYSFTIDNYDKRFNEYLPGGKLYTSFVLREVNVFMGIGEENHKNKLVFSGVTNLNNGISEEDEKLKITAYDISYLYNIPVALNKFSNIISDKEYAGKPIPILFGDYTTYGKYIGGIQRPIIPAVFYKYTATTEIAKLIFNNAVFGISKSMLIQALSYGPSYNDHQIELIYSNELKNELLAPSVSVGAAGGGKYKFTVTLYRGKKSNGTLYSSTKWIADCLLSTGIFTGLFNIFNVTNEPILYYKNLILTERSDNYAGDIHSSKIYYTGGGVNTLNAFYKICSNGLNRDDISNFKIWYNHGSYDNIADWETDYNKHGSNTLTPTWDCDNGEVIVHHPGSLTEAELLKSKLYVFVSGQKLTNGTLRTDSDLLMNFANNTNTIASINGVNYISRDMSGNGAYGVQIGKYEPKLGDNFPLGGYIPIQPFMEKINNKTEKVCYWQSGMSFGHSQYICTNRTETSLSAEFSALVYNFKRVDNVLSKNFVFEMQVRNETFSLSALGYRKGNSSQKNLAVFGENDTNKIYVYLDANNYLCVSYNGYTTKASSQPISDLVNKIYGVKVVKDGTTIKLFVSNITDSTSYTETTYAIQTPVAGDFSLNYCIIGNSSQKPNYTSGGFYGKIGMVRFRVNQTSFQHEQFTIYGVLQDDKDAVSIAKKILEFSGVTEDMFDETWDDFYKSKVNQQYSFRAFINETDIKTVDYVVELLIQVGLVLTMKESNGKMKFSLIWDDLPFYEKSNYRITAYDIILNSVNVDRELNQYFNTANAKYNYSPASDELSYSQGDFYEPNAVRRDGNLNVWFNREDKGIGSFEFKNLYINTEVINVLKYRIANSTPNSEMINLKLSWRHLLLQVGDFVSLNYGRFVNVPCQVRSIKLDANGSSIDVKLRSLESINFIDANKNIEYVPTNFDDVGGIQAIGNILAKEDSGDV